MADGLNAFYRIGSRRTCEVVGLSRSSYYYTSVKDDRALRQRIREIDGFQILYGNRCIHVLLRCEVWHVNHKRAYRIYREEGLNLRHKIPWRSLAVANRLVRPEVSGIDQCWSMDFVADNLLNGRRIRALTIVDNWSRECEAIHVDRTIEGQDVATVMERLRLFKDRCRNGFSSTTAANSFRRIWIDGLMRTG